MKKMLKVIAFLLFLFVLLIVGLYHKYKSTFTTCALQTQTLATTTNIWTHFVWSNNKASMHIPVKVANLPYSFTFQLDLGSPNTIVYGNTLQSVSKKHLEWQQKISYPAWLLYKMGICNDVSLNFGNYVANYPACPILKQMGNELNIDTLQQNSEVALGTLGVNTFANKVLIIDYPNQRFCILDTMPKQYTKRLTSIRINNRGKIILPLIYQKKNYRCLFDSGSSMFELLTTNNLIEHFSITPNVDTIQAQAWGKMHTLTSKILPDTVTLAGAAYPKLKIYADYRTEAKIINCLDGIDAITGNALFWEKVLAIDFKYRRMAIVD